MATRVGCSAYRSGLSEGHDIIAVNPKSGCLILRPGSRLGDQTLCNNRPLTIERVAYGFV